MPEQNAHEENLQSVPDLPQGQLGPSQRPQMGAQNHEREKKRKKENLRKAGKKYY